MNICAEHLHTTAAVVCHGQYIDVVNATNRVNVVTNHSLSCKCRFCHVFYLHLFDDREITLHRGLSMWQKQYLLNDSPHLLAWLILWHGMQNKLSTRSLCCVDEPMELNVAKWDDCLITSSRKTMYCWCKRSASVSDILPAFIMCFSMILRWLLLSSWQLESAILRGSNAASALPVNNSEETYSVVSAQQVLPTICQEVSK